MLDRIIALCVLLAAIVIPVNVIAFFQMREVQFIASVIVVVVTVLYDYLAGLILGLTLIVIYYRLHWKYMTYSKGDLTTRLGGPMVSLVREYITPEHLHDAQSNVVDESNLNQEMVGVKGIYGEDVYGAQGMYKGMPGLSNEVGELLPKSK